MEFYSGALQGKRIALGWYLAIGLECISFNSRIEIHPGCRGKCIVKGLRGDRSGQWNVFLLILRLKYIQVARGNGLVYVAIRVECRYLENALQIADATIASKLSLYRLYPWRYGGRQVAIVKDI